MKKKKGAAVRSRAAPRRPAPKRTKKTTSRPAKAREASRLSRRNGIRRELYPPIEPFRHGHLRVSDVHEIYYEECGNPAGKPAVFLHGGPGAGSDKRARQFFDPQHYRIVVFDQRGCGRSRPSASLIENTTWHLVADLERLRKHLGIERWLVFGGSWGSTLALAYAEANPERVSELVLRGIFLLRYAEIRWFYQHGASEIFPDAWEAYRDAIPHDERDDFLSAYHKRLVGSDQRIALAAARAWSVWEASASFLLSNGENIKKWAEDEFALSVARIECHYFVNRGFLRSESQLLDDVPRIRHIPTTIVQGRYDVVCPATSAWDLHRAWPETDLRIVPDAGHSAFEPGNSHELVLATDRYRSRSTEAEEMRRIRSVALTSAALVFLSFAAQAAPTKLLRFPNIWHDRIVFSYAGDLWTVGTQGGAAAHLTSNPGLELFGRFSPDGRFIAFTGQYGGDEQVYVMPADGGAPKQLTFFPARGPLADRWGYDNQVYGWTPDGTAVLFRSARDSFILTGSRLYTVPMNGGAATALPMPVAGAGQFSPDGKKIVYSPLWRDFRSEKRYQGGWANDLYIFDLLHPALLQVTNDPRTDRDPMWVGGAIYFNSDRTGVFNLFRYDTATRQTTQLTHYQDWDVRWPSADAEGQIVYESDGELHIYDTRNDQDRKLSISVPADATTTRRQSVNAADNIESLVLSPGGERVGIVARGDVFSVPVEHGTTRNLTQSSSAHDREAAWSSDGKRLAYVSDRSGEEEIYIQTQDGNDRASQLTSGSSVRYYAPRWSGDDRRIAFADSTGRLSVVEVATKKRSVIARDPADLTADYRWSPDGRYLSYSLNESNGFSAIFIWSAADGQSRRVTPQFFNSQSPAWAPNGELLYFLSVREYQPLMSSVEFDFATDRQTGIFAVTLRKDAANPFGIRNDEPGDDKQDADDAKVAGKANVKGKKQKAPVKIDFEGIEQRAIRVPVEADNLSNLSVGHQSLLYQRSGPFYYGRDSSAKSTVMAYSLKDREAKPVAEDVIAWSATADGKHVLAQLSSKEIKYYAVGKSDDKSDDAKTVSLAGLMTTRVPAVEWREIFAEVWRRYRDYFYVDNMHGYDWPQLREKYRPLLDYVGSRSDLNYVIAEMISELTVQHAYIEGGDLGLPKRPFVALPGARFELDAKSARYRIARIFAGQNEEDRYRSPLTEVGVDVHVGDYLLAINGRELNSGTDPYELLQSAPNQPVEWRVSATADGKAARTIRYQPLGSEHNLLYLAWVAENRARVDRMSQGRLGYIHIPDMGEAGIREFIKWWYPQVRKEGLVVDVRDNAGGNISEMLIERLARTLRGTSFARNRETADTYPRVVQPGPKVALINEVTSSDGDIFSYAFRQWKIGPLIGKRTWGGAVGITDHGPLLDGGTVFVPEFGTADANGRWIIEGHGVDPDIVVEQDPVEVLKGHDPQLERGVEELLKRLPATPAALPQRAAPPNKTGAP